MTEHLLPEESPFDRTLDEYHRAVAHWLLPEIGRPVIATVVCIPSFEAEWTIRIHGSEDLGYAATLTEPSTHIYCAGEYAIDGVTNRELELTTTLASQLHEIWCNNLRNTRYKMSPSIGMDGTTYHFSCHSPTNGRLCGKTWSPDPETRPGRLALLCHSLRCHLSRGSSETELTLQSEIGWFKNAPARPPVRDGAASTLRKHIIKLLTFYDRGAFPDAELVALISSEFDNVRYPDIRDMLDIVDLLPENFRQCIRQQNRA